MTTSLITAPNIALAAAFALALPLHSMAQDAARASVAAVDTFYEAIRTADADMLSGVLAEDAVIRLADLGFDMTAEEFVASMDEWEAVAKDMTMRVRPDPATPDTDETIVRLVCYEFPSNASMTRETSTVVDGAITANMQEEVAENCEGF